MLGGWLFFAYEREVLNYDCNSMALVMKFRFTIVEKKHTFDREMLVLVFTDIC